MLELGRFASIGLLATLVHVLAALGINTNPEVTPQMANLFGFACSVLISYFGHQRFTFQVVANHAVHFPRFVVLALTSLVVSSMITQIVTEAFGLPFSYAMGLVALFVPAATYFGAKLWAFSEQRRVPLDHLSGYFLILMLGVIFLTVMWGRTINHDTAWYLYATRKWLDGARLYVDIVEVNPPLNFYLTIPAIWISDHFDFAVINAQFVVIAGLLTTSLSWVWTLLQTHSRLTYRRQVWIVLGTAFALTVPATSGVAQREHLMMILITPYIFGYMLLDRPDAGSAGGWRAFVAAIGLCIKLHFMLFPIALTLVRVVQLRQLAPIWSVSNLVIVSTGALYVLSVRVIHPEYLLDIIPMALMVYGDYGFSAEVVLQSAAPTVIVVFLLSLALSVKNQAVDKGGFYIVAAVIAAILSYATQWTGYRYQAYPIFALITLFAVWTLAHRTTRTAQTYALSALLAIIGLKAFEVGHYRTDHLSKVRMAIDTATPNPSVMVFSTSLVPAFPLVVETNAKWSSRYPAMWLIPGSLNPLEEIACSQNHERCKDYANIVYRTRSEIVEDFIAGSPDVIIFDKTHRYIKNRDFDFRTFLEPQDGFMQKLENYAYYQTVGVFEIWKKK